MKYVFFGCNEATISRLLKHLDHLEHTVRDDTLSFLNVSEEDVSYIEKHANNCCDTCQDLGTSCRIRMKLPN